jgi:hypothetical protein
VEEGDIHSSIVHLVEILFQLQKEGVEAIGQHEQWSQSKCQKIKLGTWKGLHSSTTFREEVLYQQLDTSSLHLELQSIFNNLIN